MFGHHLDKSTTICLFIHVSCVVSFCTKQGDNAYQQSQSASIVHKLSPFTPRKIIKKINKAIAPYMCMKTKPQEEPSPNTSRKTTRKIGKVMVPYICIKIKNQEDEGCLWKKTILMGDKCQPLEFSGAIFYDSEGNQISELPRSPRSSAFGSPSPKRFEIEV